MTKKHEIIHLNGFMYAVEEVLLKENEFYIGYPDYVAVFKWVMGSGIHEGKSAYARKVVATTDPSLNLPLLPVVEDNLSEIQELVNDLPVDWIGTGSYESGEREEREWQTKWDKAYQAASTKQFTEEDLRKAFYNGGDMKDEYDWNCYIQSLKPKPVAVEIEINVRCAINKIGCDCDICEKPLESLAVGTNNFVKVNQWIYE